MSETDSSLWGTHSVSEVEGYAVWNADKVRNGISTEASREESHINFGNKPQLGY